jgi:hypothetical protein
MNSENSALNIPITTVSSGTTFILSTPIHCIKLIGQEYSVTLISLWKISKSFEGIHRDN